MNCLTARETLDLAPPEEAQLYDAPPPYDAQGHEIPLSTFDEAARHVKSCPACQTAVRRREKLDERIGQLMRDLPVPAGLRERLLARLESEAVTQTPESQTPESQTPREKTPVVVPVTRPPVSQPSVRSRRRLFIAAAAACVMAALSVGVWQFAFLRRASLSMDEIAGYALSNALNADELPVLARFQGGGVVPVPKTMRPLSYATPFRRLVDPQLGDREIAVYFFPIGGRKGVLAVVPAALVKDVPAATSFLGLPPVYNKGYCTTAWVEGSFVYLCCVEGGGAELDRLRPVRNDSA